MLDAIGQNVTPDQWYNGLLARTGRQLGLEDELDDYWTNGHPFLTQRHCEMILARPNVNEPENVDDLCMELFLSREARERDDNLLYVRDRIVRSEVDLSSLLETYSRIHEGQQVQHDETNPLPDVLLLSGISRVINGAHHVRNRIYFQVIARLAQARGLAGDSAKAREGLERLRLISRETFAPAFAHAIVYSGLGDNDQAFECLERACRERNANLVYLNVDPTLHSLRSDPRYGKLLARVGLPT